MVSPSSTAASLSKLVFESQGLTSPSNKVRRSQLTSWLLMSQEETYQQMKDVEHVLSRPDTYVGSCKQHKDVMPVIDLDFVPEARAPVPRKKKPTLETTAATGQLVTDSLDSKPDTNAPALDALPPTQLTVAGALQALMTTVKVEAKEGELKSESKAPSKKRKRGQPGAQCARIVEKEITYVPALLKIFDEILVNAADRRVNGMDTLKVDIDEETGQIKVWNNGKSLDVEFHKKAKMYVPQLVFGEMRTSTNYDDTEERTTGGRNGYGAKLTNVFSDEFVVETLDSGREVKYRQRWKNNMSVCKEPKMQKVTKGSDYTCITFRPSYKKYFGYEDDKLSRDMIALMHRRVYDIAGACNKKTDDKPLKVYLNGKRIPIKNFADYVRCYLTVDEDEDCTIVHEIVNNRWVFGVLCPKGWVIVRTT